MWGYNLLCVCVCVCAMYSDRTPKVAPETSLQISNGAVLKLPSAQSRCGFQAFQRSIAEKLQLIYTLSVLALLFHALNLSLFFSVACRIDFFSCKIPEISVWPQSTASCEGLLQPISGRGTTCERRGHLLVKHWEGKTKTNKKNSYLLYVLVNVSEISTSALCILCFAQRVYGEKL